MKKEWDYIQNSPTHSKLCTIGRKLFAVKNREHVVDVVKNSPMTIICGHAKEDMNTKEMQAYFTLY